MRKPAISKNQTAKTFDKIKRLTDKDKDKIQKTSASASPTDDKRTGSQIVSGLAKRQSTANAAKRQGINTRITTNQVDAYGKADAGDVPAYRRRIDTPAGSGYDVTQQRYAVTTDLIRKQQEGRKNGNLYSDLNAGYIGERDARNWANEYRQMGQIEAADWFDNAADILASNNRASKNYAVAKEARSDEPEKIRQMFSGDYDAYFEGTYVSPEQYAELLKTGNDYLGGVDTTDYASAYNDITGVAKGSRSMADNAEYYAQQQEIIGDPEAAAYFRENQQAMSDNADALDEYARSLYSDETREKLANELYGTAWQEKQLANEATRGTDTHLITDAERGAAASNINDQIAQYDADIAALEEERMALEARRQELDPDGTRLIDARYWESVSGVDNTSEDIVELKWIESELAAIDQQISNQNTLRSAYDTAGAYVEENGDTRVYDDDAMRDISEFDDMFRLDVGPRAEYMQTYRNLNWAAGKAQDEDEAEEPLRVIDSVHRAMDEAGVSYSNDDWTDEWYYASSMGKGSKYNNYTYEEYATLKYAEENNPLIADYLEQYYDAQAGKRRSKQVAENARNLGEERPVVAVPVAVATGVLSAIDGIDTKLQSVSHDLGFRDFVNPYRVDFSTTYEGATAGGMAAIDEQFGTTTLNELINSKAKPGNEANIPIAGDMTLSDLYGVGVEVLRNSANTAVFGSYTPIAVAFQTYDEGYTSAYERGASPDQANKSGMLSALSEGVGEKISYETFTKFFAGDGIMFKKPKNVVMFGLLSVLENGEEFVQESATTAMNEAFDRYVMGENSQYNIDRANYIAAGYSPEEAERLAGADANERILRDGLTGALTGFIRVGGGAIASKVSDVTGTVAADRSAGREIRKLGNEGILAERMSETTGKTVNAPRTNWGAGRLQRRYIDTLGSQIERSRQAEDDAALEQHYEDLKRSFFGTADVDNLDVPDIDVEMIDADQVDSETDTADVNTGKLTPAEKDMLLSIAGRIRNDRKLTGTQRKHMAGDEALAQTVKDLRGGKINADRTNTSKLVDRAIEAASATSMKLAGTTEETIKAAEERMQNMHVSQAASSTYNGDSVKINGIKKVADNDDDTIVTVTLEDGSAKDVKLSEISLSNRDAEIYAYAANMPTEALANQFRMLYGRGQDISRVAAGMTAAYEMGAAGYKNYNTVTESALTKGASDAQIRAAYNLGQKAYEERTARDSNRARSILEAVRGKDWHVGKVDKSGIDYKNLSAEQKRNVDITEAITLAGGVNVVFFESEADENGDYTRENGRWEAGTRTIYLDVNAGRNNVTDSMSETALLRTLSHELTHAMQTLAGDEYRQLREAVLDVLERTSGNELEVLIQQKIERDKAIKTRDKTIKTRDKTVMTRDEAIDEVVAEACETMLRDSKAAEMLQTLHPKEARTFIDLIKDLLRDIKNAIKNAYGRTRSREAQIIEKEIDNIAEKWTEAFEKMSMISGRMQKATAQKSADTESAEQAETVGMHNEPARPADAHIDQRIWSDMGDRKVNAFQNDYKYARLYMPAAAAVLRGDLANSVKGERFMTPDGEWNGQKRITTPIIAEALDNGLTWDSLEEALTTIQNVSLEVDPDSEMRSNAAIKRAELMLDNMLSEGYEDSYGNKYAPDAEYIAYKNTLPGAAKSTASEATEGSMQFRDVQFEMRTPVEYTRNFVALHNLTEDKLAKAMKLGGFPMPSIAIARTDIGHQNFGPISLVFGRETIDPKVNRKNKVYSADAWTPTFPRVEYEVNAKAENRIREKLSKLKVRVDPYFEKDLYRTYYDIEDQLNRYDGAEGVINNVVDNYGLKAAYLEDNGTHAQVITHEEEQKREVSNVQAEIYEAIADLVGLEGLSERPLGEIRDMYGAQLEEIYPGSTKSAIRMARILQNVIGYFENKNAAPQKVTATDADATRAAIDDAIDRQAYEKWVRELYADIEGASGVYNGKELYTASGNRRSFASTHYPVSVENIAKAMYDAYGGKMKNVSAQYDAKTMRAVTAKTFRSVEEMHKYEGRMRARTQEEADALTNDLNSRLNALVSTIQADKNAGKKMDLYDQMTQADQIGSILQEIAVKKYDATSIKNGLANYGYQISNQTAAELSRVITDISEMPVNIFEAKPERAVYFGEVKYAIVPNDMDGAIRQQLEELVPDVREYTEGDEERRLELLNELQDVRFQARGFVKQENGNPDIRYQPHGNSSITETDAFKRWFGKSKIVNPDGTPKIMYHGTPYGGFTTFKDWQYFTDNKEYADVYHEPSASSIRGRYNPATNPTTYAVYLSVKKPFDTRDPKCRRIWQKEFYDNYSRTPLTEKGLPDWTDGIDLVEFIEDNDYDYDAIILDEGAVGGYGEEVKSRGISVVVRNSNQIKSATDNIGTFDPNNPDIRYQPREDAISTRQMLADMMSFSNPNAEEQEWLDNYRSELANIGKKLDDIKDFNSKIRELSAKKGKTQEEKDELKSYRAKVEQLREEVSKLDEGLLKLSNSDVIRSLVNRGSRERVLRIAERQRTAAIRKNVIRRARRLDRMLRQPKASDHIPEEFRGAVTDLLVAFTKHGDAFGGDKASVRLLQQARLGYMDMFKRLADEVPQYGMSYDEATTQRLGDLANILGEKSIYKLDFAEMTEVSKILDHFEGVVRDLNEDFSERRIANTVRDAALMRETLTSMQGRKDGFVYNNALVNSLRELKQSTVLPVYFFKHMGGTLGKLGERILEAENTYGIELGKATAKMQELQERFHHDEWFDKKGDTLKIEKDDMTLELTREEALGIWATNKREKGDKYNQTHHLDQGGVVVDHRAKNTSWRGKVEERNALRLGEGEIAAIDNWLTKEQKDYADAVVYYLSHDMAALGNETSMELMGYKVFGSDYYYPYKTSSDFLPTKAGEAETMLFRNMGMTKALTRHAKTPIVITDFTSTVSDHINNMLLYSSFAAPQDAFMRVLDFKFDDGKSIKSLLANAYGTEQLKYIRTFMNDLYGAERSRVPQLISKVSSAWKKARVMASMSVVVQQPTAVLRAMAYVNPKYFATQGVKLSTKAFEEAKKYAGTAVIKDMGRFDTGLGVTASDYISGKYRYNQGFINKVKNIKEKTDDVLGKGAEVADKWGWSYIWDAVKREQAEKAGLDINSEELKQIAGKRMDEVVRLTQVYDSTLAKSQIMRNKDGLVQMFTAFMAEPLVTKNMMMDAWYEARKGNKKGSISIVAGVFGSMLLANMAKAIISAWREDDEDEKTYIEHYIENFFGGMFSDVNPINYMPYIRDMYSVLQGYDVERTDISMFSDIVKAIKIISNPDKPAEQRWKSFAVTVGMFTNIPIENIYKDLWPIADRFLCDEKWNTKVREGAVGKAVSGAAAEDPIIKATLKMIDGIFGTHITATSKNDYTDELYDKLLDGDVEEAHEIRDEMKLYVTSGDDFIDDAGIDAALRNRIYEGFIAGDLDREEASRMLDEHAGLTKTEADKRTMQWQYEADTRTKYDDGIKYDDVKYKYIDGAISDTEAMRALTEYGGQTEDEAEAKISEWDFERKHEFGYSQMKDAYFNGEITREDAISARVEYGGQTRSAAEETVSKWDFEAENDVAYSEMKDAYIDGDLTNTEVVDALMKYGGMREPDARAKAATWDYEKDTGREWDAMKDDYIAGRLTADQVVNARAEYADEFAPDVKAQIRKWDYEKDTGRPYNEMKTAYIDGEIKREDAIADRINYGGQEADAAELDVSKWDFEVDYGYDYDDMPDYFSLGRIDKDEAIAARMKYGLQDPDDAYFAVTGWEYENETGKEWQGKNTKVYDAIDSGNAVELRDAITEVYEYSDYETGKKAASAVTSAITSHYKPLYIAASPAERAAMEPMLLDAYELAYTLAGEQYYGDNRKLKTIRGWLET